MKSTFKIERPDDIEVTLTTTMTLREWKQVKQDLAGNTYAQRCFADSIRDVIARAEQQFAATHPESIAQ
jgi:hypothetical protein